MLEKITRKEITSLNSVFFQIFSQLIACETSIIFNRNKEAKPRRSAILLWFRKKKAFDILQSLMEKSKVFSATLNDKI